MAYALTGHPLLSPEAAALTPEALAAQGEVAELVLGLVDTALTGDAARRATHAVVLQVNRQVEAGAEGSLYASRSRGSQAEAYRVGASGQLPAADPVAWRLARRLVPFRTRFVP